LWRYGVNPFWKQANDIVKSGLNVVPHLLLVNSHRRLVKACGNQAQRQEFGVTLFGSAILSMLLGFENVVQKRVNSDNFINHNSRQVLVCRPLDGNCYFLFNSQS
jgi:hypothetical protein